MSKTRSPRYVVVFVAALVAVTTFPAMVAVQAQPLGSCNNGTLTPNSPGNCLPLQYCRPAHTCQFLTAQNGNNYWFSWTIRIQIGACNSDKINFCLKCVGGSIICATGVYYATNADCTNAMNQLGTATNGWGPNGCK